MTIIWLMWLIELSPYIITGLFLMMLGYEVIVHEETWRLVTVGAGYFLDLLSVVVFALLDWPQLGLFVSLGIFIATGFWLYVMSWLRRKKELSELYVANPNPKQTSHKPYLVVDNTK